MYCNNQNNVLCCRLNKSSTYTKIGVRIGKQFQGNWLYIAVVDDDPEEHWNWKLIVLFTLNLYLSVVNSPSWGACQPYYKCCEGQSPFCKVLKNPEKNVLILVFELMAQPPNTQLKFHSFSILEHYIYFALEENPFKMWPWEAEAGPHWHALLPHLFFGVTREFSVSAMPPFFKKSRNI